MAPFRAQAPVIMATPRFLVDNPFSNHLRFADGKEARTAAAKFRRWGQLQRNHPHWWWLNCTNYHNFSHRRAIPPTPFMVRWGTDRPGV